MNTGFKTILKTAVVLCGVTLSMSAWAKDDPAAGEKLYATHCVACHGANRAGVPPTFPALTDVGKRLKPAEIKEKISKGGGLMPPFSQLSQQEIDDLASFLAK